MAKTIATRKRIVRRDWTRADVKVLRQHSRDKTPVKTISRALKRTPAALRQKARALGIPLGHRRPKRRRARATPRRERSHANSRDPSVDIFRQG